MRRALFLVLALATFVVGSTPARAAESEWHSDQPVAAGIETPVPFGEVGDIEFWSPNRGLLITAGNSGMPAGLYAYDGTGWHLYSTVCGGTQGRIAWAGPDEFWTISDQRPSEEPGGGSGTALMHRSLCHFKNGEVVASYAEPIGQGTSYLPMSAAACEGPDNCWFGGERLPAGGNTGAFHVHWDGSNLSPVPSLTVSEPDLKDPGRSVFDIAFHQGQLYESVSVRAGDEPVDESEPSYLHRVSPTPQPFEPLFTPGLVTGGTPEGLDGFHLAGDGTALWAMSGAAASGAGSTTTPTLLRLEAGAFEQVPLTGGILAAGFMIKGFAMEPGTGGAWASFTRSFNPGEPAHLAFVEANGTVDPEIELPRPEEELNIKGVSGPVSCPAAGQCWMATGKGWLFHLGGPLPQDTDPAMQQLITFRPCDDACRSGNGVGLPEDNSGAEPEAERFPEVPEYEAPPKGPRKPRPLYNHLKQKVIDGNILQLTFDLHAEAHVQLIAEAKKKVVAKTPRMTMDKGHHRIRLRLDPKHWPTHLSFQVHRIKTKKQAAK